MTFGNAVAAYKWQRKHDLEIKPNTGGQVILSGDMRQHGAVEASDALRAIERYGGLEAARLMKIRRQNPKVGQTKSERKCCRSDFTQVHPQPTRCRGLSEANPEPSKSKPTDTIE
ncbi:MAG TPA: AAA family ATPase [Verrucomicrobiae bacterium]|nr:AAA family ATPase [Verrucomicrobiae bacterium]